MILEAPALKDGTGKELRRLHDTAQQHVRALKAMGHEPPGPFITSLLEIKLDANTMFEWQRHSQESAGLPHFSKILEFLDLRAQASEMSVSSHKGSPRSWNPDRRGHQPSKPVTAFTANATDAPPNCIVCGTSKHPLYACTIFKSLSHEKILSTLRDNNYCLNCLKPGHFVRECKSLHRCRKCQKPQHSLLHVEPRDSPPTQPPPQPSSQPVTSNLAAGLASNSLLMTFWVLVHAPNGSVMKVRALLDSASFISERLTHLMEFPRTHQNLQISGVAGLSHATPSHSIVQFAISPVSSPADKSRVSAIVVPRVTCDLPVKPVTPQLSCNHISDIALADPDFGRPSRIDLLLGVDIFVASLLHGRRLGPHGSPTAFETKFGWVLAGLVESEGHPHQIATHHASLITGDDLLNKFWEIEEGPGNFSQKNEQLSLTSRKIIAATKLVDS